MSALASSTAEFAEGKTNLTPEITATDEGEASKERSTSQPSLEPSRNHFKPTTSKTSEEDASGRKPADQTTAVTATETPERSSQREKIEAGSDAVAGRSGVDDSAANHTDAQLDSKLEEKADGERQEKVSRGEESSDEDSQDNKDSGDESDGEARIVYTAEVQDHHRKSARKRIKDLDTYFKSVEYRMNFFEQELKKLRGDDTQAKAKPQLVVENTSPIALEVIEKTPPAVSEIIPSIRRMNWADFKPSELSQDPQDLSQRFASDRLKVRANLQEDMESKPTKVSGNQQHGSPGAKSKHQHHVLEVLVEDPGASKRRRVRKHTNDGTIAKGSDQKAKTHQRDDTTMSQSSSVNETPVLQCPERVRICSRHLVETLRSLLDPEDRYFWDISHLVFLRPFKFFVLYEAGIRVALKNLEKQWQTKGQTTPTEQTRGRKKEEQKNEAGTSNGTNSQNDDITTAEVSSDQSVKTDTFEALEHLRLLVDFLDNDLRSTFTLREQINAGRDCPIAFSDLWHLYEHGQEVRTPNDPIQVFKIVRFTGGRDLLTKSPSISSRPVPRSCIERQGSESAFFIECYRYDFNGTLYGPVHTMFEIRRYEGLRYITSLPVYPLRFDADYQKERIRLARRGDKFIALAQTNRIAHKSYRGLSLDEHAEEVSWFCYFSRSFY